MPGRFSVLIADPIAKHGVELLRRHANVDFQPGLGEAELLRIIGNYHAVVVRSETKLTARVIDAGRQLQVIARAGVGVDNIDLEAATRCGIVVVNAPTGNAVAAAEHAIALLLAVARRIPQAYVSLRAGKWERGRFVGVEVRHKTLGVVGLGKIGSLVARRALGLEMRVIGYDPFVSPDHARNLHVELVSLEELLRRSDFITLHTTLTASTRALIGAPELGLMKPTAYLINTSRGEIVDEQALYQAVEEGDIAGAAIDVFSVEPAIGNRLLQSERIVATPHLGASTAEAQVTVALDAAEQVMAVLEGRPVRSAVNLPAVPPEVFEKLRPFLDLAEKLGRLATQLAEGQLTSITITYGGEVAQHDTDPLRAMVIKGLLEPVVEDRINLVNADVMARARGLPIVEETAGAAETYTSLLTVRVGTSQRTTTVAGTVLRSEAHIVQIDGYWLDLVPNGGHLLISHHLDRPGMIGAVGTLLGTADINVSFMQVSRLKPRGRALMVLGLDDPIPEEQQRALLALPDIHTIRVVKL